MFRNCLRVIFFLGMKEFAGVFRDPLLMGLILYSFSLGIYISANAKPDSLHNAAIAVVDEDRSPLSRRITDAFQSPMFSKVVQISRRETDVEMDKGRYTFVLVFPPDFQKDLMADRRAEIQLNVDATRMSQAFTGANYIQQIIEEEIAHYTKTVAPSPAAGLVIRNSFNQNLQQSRFASVVQLISSITLLAVILTGAALIREREHGTLEHLLVLPLNSFEIMAAKIWAMGVLVLITAGISHYLVIGVIMKVPMAGSRLLFMAGMALYLFAVTSIGIFLACIAENMPQLGILLILVLMPMEMLSGGMTPLESMPELLQKIMVISPETQFVSFCQGVLYRGAGVKVVWQEMLSLFLIGSALFAGALFRFRRSVT